MITSPNPRVNEIMAFMCDFIERHHGMGHALADAIQQAFPEASGAEKTEAVVRFISLGLIDGDVDAEVSRAIETRRRMN